MTFEYLITHEPQRDEPILSILRERLLVVMEDNLNDVEHEALARMVQTDFQRLQASAPDGALRSILSFKLVLPEETASIQEVVDEFTDALAAAPVLHVLKFEDPLLREELAARAEELFGVEMKLRRVLSIIYLHAYPDADPYELLKEEVEQPMSKAKPEKTAMKAAAENQLFHLTFGQYVNLNQRPAIKDFAALIKSQDTYEAFRAELMRQPVRHEDDASLLSSLKERMDAIERMRNCVAHNRRPTKGVKQSYLNALPLVHRDLDNYLYALSADWSDYLLASQPGGDIEEDYRGKEAIREALENAEWDEEDHSIRICDHDGEYHTVRSREELETLLCRVGEEVWCNSAMVIDGDYVGASDEAYWVSEALEEYEERLNAFFATASDADED